VRKLCDSCLHWLLVVLRRGPCRECGLRCLVVCRPVLGYRGVVGCRGGKQIAIVGWLCWALDGKGWGVESSCQR
jgi:hypothetical protein